MFNSEILKPFQETTNTNLEYAKKKAYEKAHGPDASVRGDLDLYRKTMEFYGFKRNRIGEWVAQ